MNHGLQHAHQNVSGQSSLVSLVEKYYLKIFNIDRLKNSFALLHLYWFYERLYNVGLGCAQFQLFTKNIFQIFVETGSDCSASNAL